MGDLSSTQFQILIISGFLSVVWGIYLIGTIRDYRETRRLMPRRRHLDVVSALRRVVVALCLWLFVFSFVFRIGSVYFGLADSISAQIVFFALLGSNVVGSLFAAATIWLDDE